MNQIQGRKGEREKVNKFVNDWIFNTKYVVKATPRACSPKVVDDSEEERIAIQQAELKEKHRKVTDDKHGSAADYKG